VNLTGCSAGPHPGAERESSQLQIKRDTACRRFYKAFVLSAANLPARKMLGPVKWTGVREIGVRETRKKETTMRRPASPQQETQAFSARVSELVASGQPVKIQVGFGWTPAPGFINLDIFPLLQEDDARFDDVDVFFFPYADRSWPIPANCVDYIFHEDFIEHISQKQQVCFLAETLRVLKDGGWHRISTPCLAASMNRHSQFEDGMQGVYTGEWDNWEHVSLFTRHSLEEVARLVGYSEVLFNLKNQGVSQHRVPEEMRPGDDRDPLVGNIFADLLKREPRHAGRRLETMLLFFDEGFYVACNSDVSESIRAGWIASGREHYIQHGFKERRAPFALDPAWYAARHPLAAVEVAHGGYVDFIDHYVAVGKARGYRPTPA
jgi:predicted SAM-dependent methyltransferase